MFVFFFKQKTAYEMRNSDWSSDVCSSDVRGCGERQREGEALAGLQHDAEVLDEDVDGALRGVIAVEDVRYPVVEHPRGAGRVGDHLVQRLRDRKSTRLNSSH